MVANDTKIFHNKKNKGQLSIEKIIIKYGKVLHKTQIIYNIFICIACSITKKFLLVRYMPLLLKIMGLHFYFVLCSSCKYFSIWEIAFSSGLM